MDEESLDAWQFALPPGHVALRPAEPRESARLLVVGPHRLEDRLVGELPALLRPDDLLVANDSRVIPAQVEAVDDRGGRVGLTVHRALGEGRWRAFARPARRLSAGQRLRAPGGVEVDILERLEGGEVVLRLSGGAGALERAGAMPLPPYIARRRAPDERDRTDYQTLFARESGSVAAPTAGLHFTPPLLRALQRAGVELHTLTLHVGPGTFVPVKAARLEGHRMHPEWGRLEAGLAARLSAARAGGRRVIAVGTTALRVLEASGLEPFEGWTDIFIRPGHRFRAVDGLFTNFHLPGSTLVMLAGALMGRARILEAYAHAIAAGYRFYSYGDASLLLPGDD